MAGIETLRRSVRVAEQPDPRRSNVQTLHHPKRWRATLWALMAHDHPAGERTYLRAMRGALIGEAYHLELTAMWESIGGGS